MEEKLQNLLSQLTEEGVEKGNREGQAIIASAKEKAESILAQAREQAAEIVAQAQSQAQEINKNTRSELQLFAAQAVSALKTEIANVVTDKVASQAIAGADSDGNLVKQVLVSVTEKWLADGNVTINAKDARALLAYFNANAKKLLDKGLTINEVKGIKTDFEIVPEKGGYKVAFGDEQFIEYFKEFLRPQLVETLF
ncbi:MAG TPA: hypothetical protein DEO38_06780 [Bacteroidales bacterium]|nr:hypothetical protein [Bacteroidales bacterium]